MCQLPSTNGGKENTKTWKLSCVKMWNLYVQYIIYCDLHNQSSRLMIHRLLRVFSAVVIMDPTKLPGSCIPEEER